VVKPGLTNHNPAHLTHYIIKCIYIIMNNVYTKKYQLEALKVASEKYPKLKIGHSYMTLMKYERDGIIQPVDNQGANWRFYSREEIQANVARVVAYKKEKLLKRRK